MRTARGAEAAEGTVTCVTNRVNRVTRVNRVNLVETVSASGPRGAKPPRGTATRKYLLHRLSHLFGCETCSHQLAFAKLAIDHRATQPVDDLIVYGCKSAQDFETVSPRSLAESTSALATLGAPILSSFGRPLPCRCRHASVELDVKLDFKEDFLTSVSSISGLICRSFRTGLSSSPCQNTGA